MAEKIKLGILKETKIPPDRRVALPPLLCLEVIKRFPNVEIYIQPSNLRTFTNKEYSDLGLILTEDLSTCDILIGIKEVKCSELIPGKTYLFFSHTAKKQFHNRTLLKEILKKKITLIDYEYLTDKDGVRLVAFGHWAGVVGCYNGILAYGKRFGLYELKRAYECLDIEELYYELQKVKLPPVKILITGGGRVAHGAMFVLEKLKIKKVTPQDYINQQFDEPVFSQIDPWHYVKRKNGDLFDFKHFLNRPDEYESNFLPYTKVTDLFVACHFWDPKSPKFMSENDMKARDFKMKVIADVSCDVNGPIPSTIRVSEIANPFYGYDPHYQVEGNPFNENNITVMAVDNLPGEAPRNTSIDFGNDLIKKVFPSLFVEDTDQIIQRATIVKEGNLTEEFSYLQDFIDGN